MLKKSIIQLLEPKNRACGAKALRNCDVHFGNRIQAVSAGLLVFGYLLSLFSANCARKVRSNLGTIRIDLPGACLRRYLAMSAKNRSPEEVLMDFKLEFALS
jgi:hypothetical protein